MFYTAIVWMMMFMYLSLMRYVRIYLKLAAIFDWKPFFSGKFSKQTLLNIFKLLSQVRPTLKLYNREWYFTSL